MPETLIATFKKLKEILSDHRSGFKIQTDTGDSYGLYGKPGPATIKAWGGKLKKPIMPVAWINIGKNYVSYHLMPIYANTALQKEISKDLKARMQGKSCFNFKVPNDSLFKELNQLTEKAIDDFKNAGFVISY